MYPLSFEFHHGSAADRRSKDLASFLGIAEFADRAVPSNFQDISHAPLQRQRIDRDIQRHSF